MTTVILCFIIADFATGFFHWLEDTYALPSWPFNIGRDNIEHHRSPNIIGTMGNFVNRNLISFCIAMVICGILVFFGFPVWICVLTALVGSMGNEVHAWNHRKKNNYLIEFIQDTAIVQTTKQHMRHHKAPYIESYCTILNINNAILDRIKFWRVLEWLLGILRIKPKRGSEEREGF